MIAERQLDPQLLRRGMSQLLSKEIPWRSYDAVIVSDGSGTNWKNACGFSSVVFRKVEEKWRVSVRHGSWSEGSSVAAEVLAVVQALTWLWFVHKFRNKRAKVLIVADNQMVVQCGRLSAGDRGKYGPLFMIVDGFERNGVQLRWLHRPRSTCTANVLADYVAGVSRVEQVRSKALTGDPSVRKVPFDLGVDTYAGD